MAEERGAGTAGVGAGTTRVDEAAATGRRADRATGFSGAGAGGAGSGAAGPSYAGMTGTTRAAADEEDELSDAVEQAIQEVERKRALAERDQEEIDRLKSETRAMISKLLAA